MNKVTIPAQHGTGFALHESQILRVIDPEGQQVCDLVAFAANDITEWLSNGRSFDYNGKIYFSQGDTLYSNKSNPMLTIIKDEVGRHDFLYTACSVEMYQIQYGVVGHHANCLHNLSNGLRHWGVKPHLVPTPFNIFQNARVQEDGRLVIAPPLSRPGQSIYFRAQMNLAIALSACSAALCNAGATKPIQYQILTDVAATA